MDPNVLTGDALASSQRNTHNAPMHVGTVEFVNHWEKFY